ncbi:HlyD family efflux transporter periplasmic adaptor subunit [Oscillospiraceae bacterium OttesenSCG-928-G22]|nr:HlyD family efflux transporter periplasmic adaptor subunit [Oscillospiraceae bacterium OttesenSCG-928-G22]
MAKKCIPIVLTVLICFSLYALSASMREGDIVPVSCVTPSVQTIYRSVGAEGRIEAVSSYTLSASAAADITKIYVKAGDSVKKGQLLMSLSPSRDSIASEIEGEELIQSVFSAFLESGELSVSPEEILDSYFSYSSGGSGTEEFPDTVESPIDGVVTSIISSERSGVGKGTQLAVVSDKSRMQATLQLNETDVRNVLPGMPVEITAGSSGRVYAGVVTEILPTVKQKINLTGASTNYVDVLVEIRAPDDALLVGSSASATVFTAKKEGTLTLPYTAIAQDDDGREIVFVEENGRASARIIDTGVEMARSIEILSGIAEGERVILNPGTDISAGRRVSVEQ